MTVSSRPPVLAIIWGALAAAQFIYAALILFVLPRTQAPLESVVSMILGIAAFASVSTAQFFWGRAMSARTGAGSGAGQTGSQEMGGAGSRGTPHAQSPGGAAEIPPVVTVWAMDEVAGVLGFVHFMIGGDPMLSLGFMGLSLTALILNGFWRIEA
jgi:hypothetical protein